MRFALVEAGGTLREPRVAATIVQIFTRDHKTSWAPCRAG